VINFEQGKRARKKFVSLRACFAGLLHLLFLSMQEIKFFYFLHGQSTIPELATLLSIPSADLPVLKKYHPKT